MTIQEKVKQIFDALTRTKVTISDFSKLSKTSRTSLHAWKNGANVSDQLRLDLALNIARRLDKAADVGRLPLKQGTKPSERFAAVKRIVQEM